MKWSRSIGMSYSSDSHALRRADDSSIALVQVAAFQAEPSCSMPMESALPPRACQARRLSRTICVTWPSLLRMT